MPRLNVPLYQYMTREEKAKHKQLETVRAFGERQYRKILVYVCKCGMKYRDAGTFRFHAARRHEPSLPYDTDYIPCLDRMEWMSVKVRRKVF